MLIARQRARRRDAAQRIWQDEQRNALRDAFPDRVIATMEYNKQQKLIKDGATEVPLVAESAETTNDSTTAQNGEGRDEDPASLPALIYSETYDERVNRKKPKKRPKKRDKRDLKKWQDLSMPDAKAIALAAIPATSEPPVRVTDSDDETTLCAEPMQWRLGRGGQPHSADMIKFLNVAVPLIYTMNHTGVALASQTLGCTAVPDEFMGYCALQRPLLIRAAPQSLPFAQKICPAC